MYPTLAVKENQQGTVLVDLTIGDSGRIVSIKIHHSNSDALDNAAVNALRRGRYMAAMHNGEHVAGTLHFSVTFQLGKQPEVKQL